MTQLTELIAAGRRGDAVAYFMTTGVGLPVEAVAQMRHDPMWPALEAVAHTLPYDGTIMGDTMRGNPLPLKRWASVTVPTLVAVGGKSPDWMRNGMRELSDVLPNARHRTLEDQTHIVKPQALAPAIVESFRG